MIVQSLIKERPKNFTHQSDDKNESRHRRKGNRCDRRAEVKIPNWISKRSKVEGGGGESGPLKSVPVWPADIGKEMFRSAARSYSCDRSVWRKWRAKIIQWLVIWPIITWAGRYCLVKGGRHISWDRAAYGKLCRPRAAYRKLCRPRAAY